MYNKTVIMKKILIVLMTALFTIDAVAQIKFSDDLNTEVSSMNKPDIIGEKLVPLDKIDIYKQNRHFGLNENPIGCGVYILDKAIYNRNGLCQASNRYGTIVEDGIYLHPCLNMIDKSFTFKPLEPGEYKISNIIRFQEHLKRWVEDIERNIETVSETDISRFGSWLEYFVKNCGGMSTIEDFILGRYNKGKGLCIYVLANDTGKEYYLMKRGEHYPRGEYFGSNTASGYVADVSSYVYGNYACTYFDSYKMVLLPFYEEAYELLGNRCAIVGHFDTEHIDFTGNMFQLKDEESWPKYGEGNGSSYISNRSKYTFYTCKDITVYKEHVTAVFESPEGDTFALPLSIRGKNGSYTSCGDENLFVYGETMNRPISIMPEKYFIEEEERHKLTQQQEEYEQFKRKEAAEKRRKDLIAKYGETDGNNIANHKVTLGMTKEMCEEAWGIWHEAYTTIREGVTTEFWVYDYKTYLYFVNGKLTRIDK